MKEEIENIRDQLLVMDAQDGDAQAMEKLVRRWQKRLWQHAFRMTADREASWDITQESWLGIIKGLGRLQDPAKFKAWAYRITTNKAFNWIKKRRKAEEIDIKNVQNYQREKEKDTGIIELVDRLDVNKKTILSLYYFEQLSVSEISEALCIPRGTVKSRLYSAREELRRLWQQNAR